MNSGCDNPRSVVPRPVKSDVTRTRRSAFAYGSGRMTTALTTVKIALLAPMPSASVAIATAAKPGDRHRPRHAKRQS
jgi:hypothetical protein